MGLGICVGGLADSLDDPETHEDQLKRFQELNAALDRAELPRHEEPVIESISAYETSYSTIHYLRRFAAHLWDGKGLPAPLGRDEDPIRDPCYRKYSGLWGLGPGGIFSGLGRILWKGRPTFSHLMNHSDAEGMYVPLDFPNVICDDDAPGILIGSSYRLKEECETLAARLELRLDLDPDESETWSAQFPAEHPTNRYDLESWMCLVLYQSASHSIRTRAAVQFG